MTPMRFIHVADFDHYQLHFVFERMLQCLALCLTKQLYAVKDQRDHYGADIVMLLSVAVLLVRHNVTLARPI